MLSHGRLIEKLDEQDIQVLLDLVVMKYTNKKQLPDVYSLWSLSPTAGLCLSILDKDGELSRNNTNLLSLKRTFTAGDIEVLDSVIELVNDLKK